jgi:hypothetical protein
VIHLLRRHGIDWDAPESTLPYIAPNQNVDNLLDVIQLHAKSTYDRLGAVLDADIDAGGRWLQLRQVMRRVGVEMPVAPVPDGTIVRGLRPSSLVGFWLMPDN